MWAMTRNLLVIAIAFVTLAPAAVHAKPEQHLAVQVVSLAQQGIALEYERGLGQGRRWSLAVGVGARAGAGGDYSSRTVAVSSEARRWLSRRWYLAARADLSRTAVSEDASGRQLGATWTAIGSALVGVRFVPWRRLEITPSAGVGYRVDFGDLPAARQGSLLIALTAGWRF